MKWYKTNDNKPVVNKADKFDKEHKRSVNVLVWMAGDYQQPSFGVYNYNSGNWSVQGYLGFSQNIVTHFCYIKPPKN